MSSSPSSPSFSSRLAQYLITSKSFLLFSLSGWIGTTLFYFLYDYLHSLLSSPNPSPSSPFPPLPPSLLPHAASLSWAISYALSIIWQHALHRYIVFGPITPYFSSLFFTYISYFLSLILSSLCSFVLTSLMGIGHQTAFGITLAVTGVINYYTVSKAMGGSDKEEKQKEKGK